MQRPSLDALIACADPSSDLATVLLGAPQAAIGSWVAHAQSTDLAAALGAAEVAHRRAHPIAPADAYDPAPLGALPPEVVDCVSVATTFEELCALTQRAFVFSPLMAHVLAHFDARTGALRDGGAGWDIQDAATPPPAAEWVARYASAACHTGGVMRADVWLRMLLFAVNFLGDAPPGAVAGDMRAPLWRSMATACAAARILLLRPRTLGPAVPIDVHRRLVLLLVTLDPPAPGTIPPYGAAAVAAAADAAAAAAAGGVTTAAAAAATLLASTRAPLTFASAALLPSHRLIDWRTLVTGLSTEGAAMRCFTAADGAAQTAAQLLERLVAVPTRATRFAGVRVDAIDAAWRAAHQALPISARTACALRAVAWAPGAGGRVEGDGAGATARLAHAAVTVPDCDLLEALALMARTDVQARMWAAAVRFLSVCGIAYRTHARAVGGGDRIDGAPMVMLPRRVAPSKAAVGGGGTAALQPLCNAGASAMVLHTVLVLQAISAPLVRTDTRTVAPLWDFACFVFQRFTANMIATVTAEFTRLQFATATTAGATAAAGAGGAAAAGAGGAVSAAAVAAPPDPVAMALPWNLVPVRAACAACCPHAGIFPPVDANAFAPLELALARAMMTLTVWVDQVRRVGTPQDALEAYDARWWRSAAVRTDDVDAARAALRAVAATAGSDGTTAAACAVFAQVGTPHRVVDTAAGEDLLCAYWCAWSTVSTRTEAVRGAGGTILQAPVAKARDAVDAAVRRVRAGMFCAANLDARPGAVALAYPPHAIADADSSILANFGVPCACANAWAAASALP